MYLDDININLSLHTFILMPKSIGQNPYFPEPDTLDSPERIRSLSDQEILDLLYHTYGNYIYTVVRTQMQSVRLMKEDVDDCFNHIIMKIAENNCKKVRQFKGESAFKTYLTAICVNMVADYIQAEIRKEKLMVNFDDMENIRGLSAEDRGINFFTDDPAQLLIKDEQEALIAEAALIISKEINRLEYQDRCILRLRIVDGRSYREIDEFLDIENSKYLFSKIINKIRISIDSRMRKRIEELLMEE
jgi:RNA polymerase sigma factor (sigma-70 family)